VYKLHRVLRVVTIATKSLKIRGPICSFLVEIDTIHFHRQYMYLETHTLKFTNIHSVKFQDFACGHIIYCFPTQD